MLIIQAQARSLSLVSFQKFQVIDTLSVDSLKAKYLSALSFSFYKRKDSLNFIKSNKELEVFAIKISDSQRLAEAYWDKGAFFNFKTISKRDSAFYYFSKAQKVYELLREDLQSARLLKSMALVQTAVHDNTGALVLLTEAIKLLKPLKNNEQLYEVYNAMGIAAYALDEYDEALEYYDLSKQFLIKTKLGSLNYAGLHNNVGLTYFKKGDYNRAKSEYLKAIFQ